MCFERRKSGKDARVDTVRRKNVNSDHLVIDEGKKIRLESKINPFSTGTYLHYLFCLFIISLFSTTSETDVGNKIVQTVAINLLTSKVNKIV